MTYDVFGGTLNLAQLFNCLEERKPAVMWWNSIIAWMTMNVERLMLTADCILEW